MGEESCQVKMLYQKPCGRRTYRSGKCIFHIEDKSDEEVKIFEYEFWKELKIMEEDEEIKVLDFTKFVFTKIIGFKDHVFNKPVSFNGAEFGGLAVQETEFKEMVDFSAAVIKNAPVFSNVKFNSVYFSATKFENGVQFINVEIEYANFGGTKFEDGANFVFTKFGNASFLKAEFKKWADFFGSDFAGVVSFIDTIFPSDDANLIKFRYIRFNKPRYVKFQNVGLSNVSFLNTDVTEIEFIDEKWAKKGSRSIVVDEKLIVKDDMTTQWQLSYGRVTYNAIAQLYRRLRRNYETNFRFAEAGDFFIGEMEMRRLNVNTKIKRKRVRSVVLWRKQNLSLLGIYKLLALYGESYYRPIFLIFVIIISYPIIDWAFNLFSNYLLNIPLITSLDPISIYPSRVIDSIASFFQLENTYLLERLVSIPILGFLFIALKRKFERMR